MNEEEHSPSSSPPTWPPSPSPWRAIARRELAALPGCLGGIVLCVTAVCVFLSIYPPRGGGKTVWELEKGWSRTLALTAGNAVEQYRMENEGRFPAGRAAAAPGKDTDTDTSRASDLMTILCRKTPGSSQNFQEAFTRATRDPKSPSGWRGGLAVDPGGAALYDPHGGFYRARLDTGGDGFVDNPNPEQAARGRATLRKEIILWSSGADGDWNTWDDNVMSWE